MTETIITDENGNEVDFTIARLQVAAMAIAWVEAIDAR